MVLNDLSGRRFGRLTVQERAKNKGRRTMWLCVCDCGNVHTVMADNLLSGATRSCGCYNIELAQSRNTTHGNSGTRLYNVWGKMLDRCRNPKNNRYKHYGARGITVCAEWMDFKAFEKWALSTGYDATAKRGVCTLDRIDNDGDYCPENCRWVDMYTQVHNRRVGVLNDTV